MEQKQQEAENAPELYPEGEEVIEGDWTRPQVDLHEVRVVTGEEDEEVFWSHRAKLYRWAKSAATWKERGLGEARLLRHKTTRRIRFLLRQEKTLKIVANHYVYKQGAFCELKPNVSSDKIWVWTVRDYAEDEPCVEQFALKFGQVEAATEFKSKFEEAIAENAKLFEAPATAAKAEPAVAKEEEKPKEEEEKEQKPEEQKKPAAEETA